jgi:lysophospholipase L1-like esterase
VPLEQYRKNVREIIARGKKITPKIIFMGSEQADETASTPVYWENTYYWNKYIKKYNTAAEEICKETEVPFLDVFDAIQKEDFFENEGVHLNAQGHKKIFEKVKKILVENNFIK